ncbi:MepB family protein [Arcicella aquatica]|uniref:MepB family protein n=1 Tax=Arcicella aquatica TaxID=217141 RepID=A0ABU5QVD2_9BACT|nr:MepB family protein [Arcicella aquatica]MEA5260774.1 MepB family protein [Arcicella aquatica]
MKSKNELTNNKDFLLAKVLVYNQCGFKCTEPIPATESAEYGACDFRLDSLNIKYRMAKITPTKTGQFVTLWKRNNEGIIEPYDINDEIDFVVISTRSDNHFGQFIFPKAVLLQKGILSGNYKEGKRAIRVYPPWDIANSKQALKTQQWQLAYFLEIPDNGLADLVLAKRLFGNQ